MTENLKKFLEAVSRNNELHDKFSNATKENLLEMAKELGIELTEADLEKPAVQELNEQELDAVAGGARCFCFLGGGGKAGGAYQNEICACVLGGTGDNVHGGCRCCCVYAGNGAEED